MELLAADDNGVRTLRLLGNFEPTDVVRFEALVEQAVAEGHTRIVVDAAHVKLVCSAALSAFLRGQERLVEAGGDLVMAGMPHFAAELFQTLGLDRRIQCVETLQEASAIHNAG